MSNGITTKIKNYRLKHSENPIFVELRKNDGAFRSKSEDHNLYDDVVNDRVSFPDATIPFLSSIQYEQLNKNRWSYRTKQQIEDKQRTAIKEYMQTCVISNDQNTRSARKLEHAWKIGEILYFLCDAISAATKGQDYVFKEAKPHASIFFMNDQWHIDLALSDITFSRQDEEILFYSDLHAHFVLTDDGFKLKSPLTSDNPVLEDFCYKKQVMITPKILAQQEFELAALLLSNHIFILDDNDERKAPAQAVLDEVKRLKSNLIHHVPLETLTDVLKKANTLIDPISNIPPDVMAFRDLATELGKRAWGKILTNAMVCLLGAALTIVGAATFVISGGASTISIVAGAGMLAASGPTLFHVAKKKPVVEKINVLADAYEMDSIAKIL
jgi:hypothetical protein